MGFGVGLLLIAAGAILAWAVKTSPSAFDVHTGGYILLVVGIVGAIVSMIVWSSWAGPGYVMRRREYVDEGPGRGRRRVVEEDY